MMIFSIVNTVLDDNFIIEAGTIEECQSLTIDNLTKRNWDIKDCYSVDLGKEANK